MARNARQNKILEIISNNEIEKQEELVEKLKNLNFNITQATISRDIKELGLIKVMSENRKYKYAYIEENELENSRRLKAIFKEGVLSIHILNNLVVLKTLKNIASAVNSCLDKFEIENSLGSVYGDDTVTIIFDSNEMANLGFETINKIYYAQ